MRSTPIRDRSFGPAAARGPLVAAIAGTLLLGCQGSSTGARLGTDSSASVVASARAAAPGPGSIPDAGAAKASFPPLADAFYGVIGDGNHVVMRLHATAGGLSGTYFYESVGDALALSGTLDERHHVVLTEKARAGATTGTFVGEQTPSGTLTGTWQSPGGARSLRFELTPIPRTAGPGPVRVFKRGYHNTTRGTEQASPVMGERPTHCALKIEYPEVFGLESAAAEAKINDALRAEDDRDCEEACAGTRAYEVTFNRDGVLSIDVTGYHSCVFQTYPSVYEGFSANFLTRTGETLTLEQVFKRPFADHTAELFERAIAAAVKDGNDMERATLAMALESPEFVFVDGGVRFTGVRKLPYSLQPSGDAPITLTFAQLRSALDPASPVAFLWKR
jgi:hypothetical protein